MASVQYLFSLTRTFTRELTTAQVHLKKVIECRIPKVILIQKIWRGYSQWEKYHRTLEAIVTIQAYYRGWRVRNNKKRYEEEHIRDMSEMRQRQAAIKIQAWWRGTMERKLLKLKGQLVGDRITQRKRVDEASAVMAAQMRKILEDNEREARAKEEADCQRKALVILYKCHHLLRTYTKEGIYSCHGRHKLSTIEMLMKSLPCKDYMDNVHGLYKDLNKIKKYREMEENLSMKEKLQKEIAAKGLESKPKSKLVIDETIHDKPFILTSRLWEKPYVKSVFTNEVRPTKPKDFCLSLREKHFRLSPILELKDRVEPYYIDFWEKQVFNKKQSC